MSDVRFFGWFGRLFRVLLVIKRKNDRFERFVVSGFRAS